jgi:RNA polymerase sigma-70 factor (ECF subfamily)
MPNRAVNTSALLHRLSAGDSRAAGQLLAKHRDKLRRMVKTRLDPRLARRVDPSDVVQDTLHEAAKRLPKYARERPIPFYPWLRQLAWERLVHLKRAHLKAEKRSVLLEEDSAPKVTDESILAVARQVVCTQTGPSSRAIRQELRQKVRECVESLSEQDQEIILLRYVEQLTSSEIAVVLGISEASAKMRHLRALRRLRTWLGEHSREDRQ